jgi:phytanoyl-CoA hydroxylase
MRLTKQQVAEFHREGYLMVEGVFGPADLQPVADEITRAIDRRAARLVEEGVLRDSYAGEPFETRLTRITAETERVYWAIASGNLHGLGVFKLLTNPRLLDLAESLVGPEIIASSAYRLRPKVPGFAHGVVPWHQDSGYFEPYCDRELVLTVWIPLVDATAERGCLQVVPRAHTGEVALHRRHASGKYLEIPDEALPPGAVVTVPVPLGGALLLTNKTPHRSTENVTDVIRWSADVRYQSAGLPTNFASPSGYANPALPPDAPPACYPPEADFLVRSARRPQDVVRRWRDFRDLRTRHVKAPVTRRWAPLEATG